MKRFQLPDPERRGFLRSVLASAVLVTGMAGLGMTMRANAQGTCASEWKVGMLRPGGLRIIPSGRSDASHVLDPNRFSRPEVRHAYWVATRIPATLNQLYC